jgi:transcriptional regulator with XRE-family HTH domain
MPRGLARIRTPSHQHNLCGAQIRARRKEMRLSQSKLCEKLGDVTSGHWNPSIYDLCRVEGGRRIVSDLELLALAIALETTLHELLSLKGETLAFPEYGKTIPPSST